MILSLDWTVLNSCYQLLDFTINLLCIRTLMITAYIVLIGYPVKTFDYYLKCALIFCLCFFKATVNGPEIRRLKQG